MRRSLAHSNRLVETASIHLGQARAGGVARLVLPHPRMSSLEVANNATNPWCGIELNQDSARRDYTQYFLEPAKTNPLYVQPHAPVTSSHLVPLL